MEENENVTEEVVQPQSENQEVAAPEVAQETETPTPEQGVTQEQEVQNVPYERFKEDNDEKNWLKQQLEQSITRPQPQQPIQQPQQPHNPYAGMDAETEKFYRNADERTRNIVREEGKRTLQTIEAGKLEIAKMRTDQFFQSHEDIKRGSPEETEIAKRITMGYNTDDAYWSVMGPRGVKPAVNKAKQQVQQKFQQKKQANVESTPGIPNSSLPNQQSERDRIGEALDETVYMK